ncbi:MAG TPA: hypothetical protein PKU80_10805 [Candidatus Limiplasma sp.]|nr:hypothetical protein [Candidatus Limiplasma sp.]HRX09556.1 hypothetical protein [Candidatus Limiplasma sp.]
MKKKMSIAVAMLLVVMLVFPVALARGQGSGNGETTGGGMMQGTGQQQGKPQEPMGTQVQNMGEMMYVQTGFGDPININVDAVFNAISQLEDEALKAELLALLEVYQTAAAGDSFEDEQAAMQALHDAMAAAGLQMGYGPLTYSYTIGRKYGKFLDTEKVAQAIAAITDPETFETLSALLLAYEDAVSLNDPRAVKDALEALMDGLDHAQVDVNSYTGLQLYMASQGIYLDTVAVEAAITALTDADTVATLIALLDNYMMAAGGGDPQAAKDAMTALMDAMEAAGISI